MPTMCQALLCTGNWDIYYIVIVNHIYFFYSHCICSPLAGLGILKDKATFLIQGNLEFPKNYYKR